MSDAARSTRRGPLRPGLILLLLVVFGAPAIVTTSLITRRVAAEVTQGDQPGGTLTGEVVDESGRGLSGESVALALISPAHERTPGPATRTDAEGRFEVRAPPWRGFYELQAGGGTLQRAARQVSFLDPKGGVIEPRPVTLELRPGSVLELTFVRGGRPAPGGSFVLEGRERRGLLFGLVPYPVRRSGAVVDGMLRLDGLPPMKARLAVELETGESVDLDLDVEPGVNAQRIEL